jgi:hypothetical protein
MSGSVVQSQMDDEKPFQRDPCKKEFARRFAAAYTSCCADVALSTGYKYLGDEDVGDLWYWLADVAMEQITAAPTNTTKTEA